MPDVNSKPVDHLNNLFKVVNTFASITVKTALSMPKYMNDNDSTYQVSDVQETQFAESNRYEKFFFDNI